MRIVTIGVNHSALLMQAGVIPLPILICSAKLLNFIVDPKVECILAHLLFHLPVLHEILILGIVLLISNNIA